jgi:hypothetical protein
MRRPPHWLHNRKHFYKYTTISTAITTLTNRTLRWSSPTLFNDPFDVQFDLHFEYDRKVVAERVMDEYWKVYSGEKQGEPNNTLSRVFSVLRNRRPDFSKEQLRTEFIDAINQGIDSGEAILPSLHENFRTAISKIKLLCFSEVFDNILMWSHYAKDHSGVVLRFECVEALDSAWGVAKPVRYEKNMPRLLNEQQAVELMSGQEILNRHAALENSIFCKASDWSYEK